jgi:transposase
MPESSRLFPDLISSSVEEKAKPASQTTPAKRLKPINRNQNCWAAIDLERLIPRDHAARGIWAMVSQLDLSGLEERIRAVEGRAGQSSLDPRLLMSLWIYGCSEGVSSARELSRLCDYEPGCLWLTGMQPINYHTLSSFRVEHKEELNRLFVQVLGLLSSEGLIEMKRITQDGTKVRAFAGGNSFRREKHLRQHLEMARQQVASLGNPDEEESNEKRQRQARERGQKEKQARLEEALKELEQLQQGRKKSETDNVRASSSDPQARVMKQANGGFAPSYNVQITTDATCGLVVGVDVTQAGNDCDQLEKAIDRVEANTGKTPQQVLVDGGYTMKHDNIERMAERGIDLIGPEVANSSDESLKRRGVQPEFYPDKFDYDQASDTFRCPAGKILKHIQARQRGNSYEHDYRASVADCSTCPFQVQCCPKSAARQVVRKQESPAVQAFRIKMQSEEAQELYRQRARIAEFPHAWIKEKFGLRQFRLRGLKKVGIEALLACLTYNICQWIRLNWRPTLVEAA